jgi:hypothetical protein
MKFSYFVKKISLFGFSDVDLTQSAFQTAKGVLDASLFFLETPVEAEGLLSVASVFPP